MNINGNILIEKIKVQRNAALDALGHAETELEQLRQLATGQQQRIAELEQQLEPFLPKAEPAAPVADTEETYAPKMSDAEAEAILRDDVAGSYDSQAPA